MITKVAAMSAKADEMTHGGDIAENFTESVRNVGRSASDAAYKTAEDLRSAGSDLLGQAKSSATDRTKAIQKRVKDEPMKAMLLSAGAGLLVGMFIRR